MDPSERIVPVKIGATGYDGQWATRTVTRITTFPPGTHPEEAPIRSELTVVKIETAGGRPRWYGFERAWIGSDLRMHVAPVNPRDEVVAAWPRGD